MADVQLGGNQAQSADKVRNWLALWVSILSIIVVLILGILTISLGTAEPGRKDAVQLVLTGVLPLIGSWVGTILAYFFSSESLRTATQSVQTLLTSQERLRSIPVRDKMIRRADMKAVETRPLGQILLVEVKQRLENAGVNRLIVLDANDYPKLVVHMSSLDRYLATMSMAQSPPVDLGGLTLQDMLDNPTMQPLLSSTFETVREEATLAEAKAQMDQTPHCQDIFVTRTGSRSEPVLGWITNIILEENSRV
jgi:hypothetical protein